MKKILYRIKIFLKKKLPIQDFIMYAIFLNLLYITQLKINEKNMKIISYGRYNDFLSFLNYNNIAFSQSSVQLLDFYKNFLYK
jgi:hypothetical protein